MKRKLIISLFLQLAINVCAQMTLNDCLLYAREHARSNILNRIEERKADADKTAAASELMPYVGLSSSGSLSFGRNIDPETNTYDNKRTLSTAFGLQLSIPVFDGLVSINNLKAAKVARMRRDEISRIEEDRISLEVIKSFYNVSYCKAMVTQLEQQYSRDSIDLRSTERCMESGTKSGADVAEMRALLANDAYELANQRSFLAKAYLKLRATMGMEPDSDPLALTEEDYSNADYGGNKNPRIADAELELKQNNYYLRAARGAFSPRISLSGGITTSFYRMLGEDIVSPGFREQWKNNMGQYIGVSVSIPLFTGLSTVSKVKRAKLELLASRVRLSQTRYEVERETTEAALDLRNANDELTAATKRLEAEEIAYRAVRRKFELGSASAIDLYTSGAKLASARAAYEGKRIQRIISNITLDYYHGKKLIKE